MRTRYGFILAKMVMFNKIVLNHLCLFILISIQLPKKKQLHPNSIVFVSKTKYIINYNIQWHYKSNWFKFYVNLVQYWLYLGYIAEGRFIITVFPNNCFEQEENTQNRSQQQHATCSKYDSVRATPITR